ncbi:MAG: glycosyltransferase family 39 protein, partial [Anaerolineae bacterium]|nr:glycosyltransferase family 39 protein [Anaerolineae bacterium]
MDRWILVELVGLAALLRLIRLGAESLWFDEAYSVAFASADLSLLNFLRPGGFAFTDKNVYHILLHFWLNLGHTEFMIRLLSVIFGVATVLVVMGVARRLFGRRAAAWAAGLLAVSPFHIWYSREARMYVLAGLFAWLAVWAVLEAVQGRRAPALWGIYALCAALGLYTHTFAIFVVAAVNVWVALVFILEPQRRKAIWAYLAANAALLVLAVPWFIGITAQQSQGWWTWIAQKYGSPGLKQLLLLPVDFALGTVRPPWAWVGWLAAGCFGIGLIGGL